MLTMPGFVLKKQLLADEIDLLAALRLYGIVGGPQRLVIVDNQPVFKDFERFAARHVG